MNAFNLWVGLGASIGLWRVWRAAPQRQAAGWLNAGLLALTAALAGARLFYILENWDYYHQYPGEWIAFWQGGLSWPGAVAGAWLTVAWLALSYRPLSGQRIIRSPLALIGDRLYPLLPTLAVSVWLGCWQIGAAYGVELPEGTWWAMLAPDERGLVVPRFPLQPVAALSLLIFFWFIETRIKPARTPGRLAATGTAGLLVHLLITSLLNASPSPVWRGLRVDTWFAILYTVIFAGWMLINTLALRFSRNQPFSSA